MTVRILADREPYASFADSASPESCIVLNGPPSLDEAAPDIVVMPAKDFLSLARGSAGQPGYIVYGPVALMGRAFERGCVDYMREPWSLPELQARLMRLRRREFRVGTSLFLLKGRVIKGAGASAELEPDELTLFRLLLLNAPLPVTREAAMAILDSHALGRCAISLRHRLESVEPGLGKKLQALRGRGYRFNAELCG